MRVLVCDAAQQFSLREVPLPEPGPGQVRLRTLWSGVSFGTEFALIHKRLSWGPFPITTGYMATGIVEAVGEGVTELTIGDRAYCRKNLGLAGSGISAVSGTHASHIVTDLGGTHGAERLPTGVPADVASLFVLPAVGLHGVDLAQPEVGALVVVIGVGQIGLGVVAACALRGCTVVAVDIDDRRLEVAKALGADYAFDAELVSVPESLHALAPGGADFVFESTGRPEGIGPAIALCRPRGTFVWQGNYGAEAFPFHFLPPHGKQLRMLFPCDDGHAPCRRWVMKGLASGTLAWEKTLTHRIEAVDAPAFFAAVNAGKVPEVVGATIHWSEAS